MKRDNLMLILSSMMALVGIVTGGAGLLLVGKSDRLKYELEELRGSMQEVVAVRRPMEAGTKLRREDVELRVMPRRYMPSNPVFEKDLEIYVGMPISRRFQGDELLLTSDLSARGGQGEACECASPCERIKVVERAGDQ
jgi:hypothetical protein